MLQFDHITLVAPSLEEGIDFLQDSLSIEIGQGARHRDMATHNRRCRLGDSYLEVIAIDPDAAAPSRPRWFGLDQAAAVRRDWDDGRRLRAWVARTDSADAVLAAHGQLLGAKTLLDEAFYFSLLPEGAPPLEGALPCVIDRRGRPSPAGRMEDQGLRLKELLLEHPAPNEIDRLYRQLGILYPPLLREGPRVRLSAVIDTPSGPADLA